MCGEINPKLYSFNYIGFAPKMLPFKHRELWQWRNENITCQAVIVMSTSKKRRGEACLPLAVSPCVTLSPSQSHFSTLTPFLFSFSFPLPFIAQFFPRILEALKTQTL